MKYICALIVVSDMQRARAFYENVLGLNVKYDFGENVSYEGDFAIHSKSHFQMLIDNKEIKSECNNFELYFEDDNVDDVAAMLKKQSVELVHELMEQPWGQRVVRFYDPDKNIVEVGESMEYLLCRLHKDGMSVEDISLKTGMPVDYVAGAIRQNDQK